MELKEPESNKGIRLISVFKSRGGVILCTLRICSKYILISILDQFAKGRGNFMVLHVHFGLHIVVQVK